MDDNIKKRLEFEREKRQYLPAKSEIPIKPLYNLPPVYSPPITVVPREKPSESAIKLAEKYSGVRRAGPQWPEDLTGGKRRKRRRTRRYKKRTHKRRKISRAYSRRRYRGGMGQKMSRPPQLLPPPPPPPADINESPTYGKSLPRNTQNQPYIPPTSPPEFNVQSRRIPTESERETAEKYAQRTMPTYRDIWPEDTTPDTYQTPPSRVSYMPHLPTPAPISRVPFMNSPSSSPEWSP